MKKYIILLAMLLIGSVAFSQTGSYSNASRLNGHPASYYMAIKDSNGYLSGNYITNKHLYTYYANLSGTTFTGRIVNSSATPQIFTSRNITKALDFNSARLVAAADNAAFAFGTWNTHVYVTSLGGHYVPIQVNLAVSASAAYDVAAARFRVDSHSADTSNANTFINVIEGRSAFGGGTIAGHAGFNMSSNLTTGTTTCTGDFVPLIAKIEGSGNISSSNHVAALMATVTSTGTGIQDCGYFSPNGATVTNVVKLETVNSATVTNMLNIANTSGTTTNGINVTGTYSGSAIVTPSIKCTGTDTTGKGSTANIGKIMYYNGHFYGLIDGIPPVWKQLDNTP